MPDDKKQPVEGTDEKVLAAVAGILPKLPSTNMEDPDRFAQSARHLIETRAQKDWPGETNSEFSVFVLVDMPRKLDSQFSTSPVVDPLATSDPLFGQMFFMNRDCSAGRTMPLPCTQGEILDWLASNGLESNALVIAYRETERMTVRRLGVDDEAQDHPIRDSAPEATQQELLDALNHFHLRKTLTPSCCVPGVWETGRAGQYVPGPDPERSIQRGLDFALNFWFRGIVRAEVEDSTNIGRIDVRLLKSSPDETGLSYWAIIELKVIKAFRNASEDEKPGTVSRSDNVKSIVEGIGQAFAYRQNREAELGMLEVFDLRKDKTEDLFVDAEVSQLLGTLTPAPHFEARAVFGSASDARKAGFTGV